MSSSPAVRARRAFTLVEVMVALAVVAMLLGALSIPLAAQLQARRAAQTARLLEEAREALLGFAVANGRLPCPSTAEGRGQESFASGGSAADGRCADFHAGFLPAAALGLSPLDAEGFLRDAWATGPRNRVRYAVFGNGLALNGVANPLTRTNGLQAATLSGLGNAAHFLFICSDASLANGAGCGPAANQLTRRAAAVLLSTGANGSSPPVPGSDEARNLGGDGVFVHREASTAQGHEYDDQVQWLPVPLLVNRMVVAGRLP
jgi:prepilin-type N-terminal cleavage/methylation domain-containing protein